MTRCDTPLSEPQREWVTQNYRYALKLANRRWNGRGVDNDLITDFATNCLIRAAQYFQPGRGCRDRKSFLGWLVHHERLQTAHERREIHRTRHLSSEVWSDVPSRDDGEPDLDPPLDIDAIRRDTLSMQDRVQLRLRLDDGLKDPEVGAIWGCSKQYVSARRKRSLARMKEVATG